MIFKKILKRVRSFFIKPQLHNITYNGERRILTQIVNLPKQKLIIFDVGANQGDYTCEILKLTKHLNKDVSIHLFEPQPFGIKIIKERFKDNVTLIINEFGLSDQEGEMDLFLDEEGSPLASLYDREHFKEQNYPIFKKTIHLSTLSQYIKQQSITEIDLIKIDVEGHELAVLKGLNEILNHDDCLISAIQFEYGGTYLDANIKLEDIFKLLSKKYRIAKITNEPLNYVDFNPKMEDYNYSNYIAVLKSISASIN